MILLHVEPNHRSGRDRIIHLAIKGAGETLCSWNMRTGKSFGGHEVYRVAETNQPVTCTRCKFRLRQRIEEILRGSKVTELEEVHAFLTLKDR